MPASLMLSSRNRLLGDPGIGSFLKQAAGLALNFVPGGGAVKTFIQGARLLGAGGGPPKPGSFVGTGVGTGMVPSRTDLVNIARGGGTGLSARKGGVADVINVGRSLLTGRPIGLGGTRQLESLSQRDRSMLEGGRRRYRHMNVLNAKALGRATRRLAGFHKFAQATETELRKLAPHKRAVGRKKCR